VIQKWFKRTKTKFQLSEAKRRFNYTGEFRLLEIQADKVFSITICRPEKKMENLSESMYYRIEEVPKDQVHLSAQEMLVPVRVSQVSKNFLQHFGYHVDF
jgi:hypothetical protein